MATTEVKGLPQVWSTHAAKYLVGEQPCLLRVWLPARFKFDKVSGDESKLTAWKTRHTELLQGTVGAYQSAGWKCSVERYFRVTGTTAILTGKTDLIAQRPNDRPRIVDCKGGKPEDSDVAQVQVYQWAIPRAWESPGMQFDGEVAYATHAVKVTPAEAQEIGPKLIGLMKRIGSEERPQASPSESSCRWCPVPKAECPDRIEATDAPVGVLTSEW